MVRRDVVARKVASARGRLAEADEIFARPVEEFLDDEKKRDLATFYLFLAIQECRNPLICKRLRAQLPVVL